MIVPPRYNRVACPAPRMCPCPSLSAVAMKTSVPRSGRKVPINPTGYNCVNVLVQRAIAKVLRKAKSHDRNKKWNNEHRDRVSEKSKELYAKKRTQRIDETTEYRIANKEHLMEKQLLREKERRKSDDAYRIAGALRSRFLSRLRVDKCSKLASTMTLAGCTPSEAAFALNSQWDGRSSKYHIDHIFPFRLYDLECADGQKMVMHISNMQPLTQTENVKKLDKLPTKAMAAKVERWAWPPGITEDMLPDIYDGWSTPLRM